jgi:hypothetical protein
MSTEPYPEVNVDESGIVPPQAGRPPEWPKKIRTLTATELDRLTIDSSGRFYWDGRLVNYEPPDFKPSADKPSEPPARTSTDVVEHDSYSFDEAKSSEPLVSAEISRTDDSRGHAVAHRDDRGFDDLDNVRAVQHHAIRQHRGAASENSDTFVAPSIQIPDRMRIAMTGWQSLGVLLIVLCFMIGTMGVAAFGFIAAHDWGCRAGLIQSHCTAVPGVRPATPRSDIPA